MSKYRVIAASCFLAGLNVMLEHGELTPETLHEDDAKKLVAQGFLEEADEWDMPAAGAEGTEPDEVKEEVKEKVTTGRNRR